jgi:phenylalanyl-tRNA synthetase beta chain
VERVPLDAPVWAQLAFGVELTLGRVANAPVAGPGTHAHGTAIAVPTRAPIRYRPLPTTPAAIFDLALLVPDTVPAAAVEQVVRDVSGAQLETVVLFDEFRGAGVADGTRSLAWRLTFRHPERTLREKEIEGRRVQLLKALEERLGVRPRSA